MAAIEPLVVLAPTLTSAPCPQERWVIVAHDYRFVDASRRQAKRQVAAAAIARLGIENRPCFTSRCGRRILPRGHFTMLFLASQRKRRIGTGLRIGSALGGITASMPAL